MNRRRLTFKLRSRTLRAELKRRRVRFILRTRSMVTTFRSGQ